MAIPPVQASTYAHTGTDAQQGIEGDDLDTILNEALAEVKETSTTTTTAATSAPAASALPMPDRSHLALTEAQREQQTRFQLMQQVEEYRNNPLRYREFNRTLVALQKMMENSEVFGASGIVPLPPNHPSGNEAIRIFEDKTEQKDVEEITALFTTFSNPAAMLPSNPATLFSQMLEMLSRQSAIYDRLVQGGKAEYLKKVPRSDTMIDQELAARVSILSQFGIASGLCQRMARYEEFDLELIVAETHALSVNQDLVPLYIQKMLMNSSVHYNILLDPELVRLRESFVDYLIEKMQGK